MNTTTKPRDRTDSKREHALTIYITDPSIKELFTKAAKRDNRKKSDWFRTYVLPAAVTLAEEQLAKPVVPALKLENSQPRHLTLFERLKADAERAIEDKTA